MFSVVLLRSPWDNILCVYIRSSQVCALRTNYTRAAEILNEGLFVYNYKSYFRNFHYLPYNYIKCYCFSYEDFNFFKMNNKFQSKQNNQT